MRLLIISLGTFFLFSASILSAQEAKQRPENCVFQVSVDETYKGKKFRVSKFGVDGLPIKDAQKARLKLNLFTDDELTADEIYLGNRFKQVCTYKKYFLSKITITKDEAADQKEEPKLIIQFYFTKK